MLDRPEWPALGDNASQADEDRNGEITRNELAVWLSHDIQKKYKVRFSPDIVNASAGYNTFFGLQGFGQLMFSDVVMRCHGCEASMSEL